MLRRLLLIIIALLVAFLGAAFSVRNAHPVMFNYYVGEANIPLSIIIVVFLAAGVILGILSSVSLLLKLKFKSSSLSKKCQRLEHDCQEKINLIKTKEAEIKKLKTVDSDKNTLTHNQT